MTIGEDRVRVRDGAAAGEHGAAAAAQASEVLELIDDYLDQLAADTHRLLGEVAGVAVTMADRRGRPLTVCSSTELARAVDELQYRIGHGPCLNALHGGGGDYVRSLAADTRWGRYGPEAAQLGARCCQSVPVEGHDGVVAVFKVYADVVDGLTAEQRRLARDAAQRVAGGIALAQTLTSTTAELADRTAAMDGRRVIDLAIGVLIERAHCTADEAFALLRQYSQTRNVKLRDVAVEVVDEAAGGPGPGAVSRAPFHHRDGAFRR